MFALLWHVNVEHFPKLNKHEQRKAREADISGKQARRKAKKVKRQASKQQSAEQQHQAAPSQPAQPEIVGSQLAAEQQGAVPDDEPLLEADFPLPGSFQLPTVIGTPVALARLNPTPSSAAKSLGTAEADKCTFFFFFFFFFFLS